VVLTSFLQHPGLAFADVLSEERIQAAFEAEGVAFAEEEDEIYNPPVSLWAFLADNASSLSSDDCLPAARTRLQCVVWK
jgi:hypothetical protein